MKRGRVVSSTINSQIKEIEAVISQVRGVLSSQVVSENNGIAEIHVLADHSRTPKQIVRDIESAALIKLGTVLDHKQISVVQLGEKGKSMLSTSTSSSSRFRFERISVSTGEEEAEISINLRLGEGLFAASAFGPNTRQYRLRLVAEAILKAVEDYLGIKNRLMAVDVQKVSMAGQEIVIVLTSFCLESGEEILPGSALNKGNEMEATVRATLDAINRRLSAIKRI